jgi:hypothetical protein
MSAVLFFPSRRLFLLISVSVAGIPALGCGDSSGVGPTFPVAGKVTLNDAPVTAKTTIVLFKPDASKGNASPFQPTGTVDADGVYTLKTEGKKGAPPGWYKVVVTAREDSPTVHPNNPKDHPASKSLVPAKYGDATTSPFSVEVVEKPQPGAYDLKLSP